MRTPSQLPGSEPGLSEPTEPRNVHEQLSGSQFILIIQQLIELLHDPLEVSDSIHRSLFECAVVYRYESELSTGHTLTQELTVNLAPT